MTLEQIATILEERLRGLQDIKNATIADGGGEVQIQLIEEKIVATRSSLDNILDVITSI